MPIDRYYSSPSPVLHEYIYFKGVFDFGTEVSSIRQVKPSKKLTKHIPRIFDTKFLVYIFCDTLSNFFLCQVT